MFKNFDKVFKFTFKNQTSTSGYRNGTIITAILLFIVPIAIFMIAGAASKSKSDDLKECGADRIYVVDEEASEAKFDTLNMLGIEGYTDIKYSNVESVDEALEKIKDRDEKTSLILQVEKENGTPLKSLRKTLKITKTL